MGREDGADDEKPVHDVTLDAFWIDQTEVTNDQFAAFVAGTGFKTYAEEHGSSINWQHPQGSESDLIGLGTHPVVKVNWEDATAFCMWAGGRLPTEAEWEYAARGPDGYRYSWGNNWDGLRANFCDVNCDHALGDDNIDDGYTTTAPVRSYHNGSSWVNTFDQTGNVAEWTNDWFAFEYYQTSPDKNPQGPAEAVPESWMGGDPKSLRDGSYKTFAPAINLQSAIRSYGMILNSSDSLGFRCAVPTADHEEGR